jgi:hypothetical protein
MKSKPTHNPRALRVSGAATGNQRRKGGATPLRPQVQRRAPAMRGIGPKPINH